LGYAAGGLIVGRKREDITMPGVDEATSRRGEARDTQILGFSTSELAGLSVDELTNNKTAITMVMHYYKQLVDENTSLRNDLNTLNSYVNGYRAKKANARIGAILLTVSNVGIGFGVNLLTSSNLWPGLATIIPALGMTGVGLYFSLKEVE
jgi:hypothetical protein